MIMEGFNVVELRNPALLPTPKHLPPPLMRAGRNALLGYGLVSIDRIHPRRTDAKSLGFLAARALESLVS